MLNFQVWETSMSLVKIFNEDMSNLWTDLQKYIDAFSKHYEDLLELLHLYLAETKTCLKVIYPFFYQIQTTIFPSAADNSLDNFNDCFFMLKIQNTSCQSESYPLI